LIQETPSGTLIKHKSPYVQAAASSLPDPTTLYKVLAVREYDQTSSLVNIGSETFPTLAAGHTLEWTEDWVRAHG
jgi:hypothetical protein